MFSLTDKVAVVTGFAIVCRGHAGNLRGLKPELNSAVLMARLKARPTKIRRLVCQLGEL